MVCLLFDNDGTLVESEQLCCEALAQVYLDEKHLALDAQELFHRFRGWQLTLILDTIASETGMAVNEQFVAIYRRRMYEVLQRDLCAVDGIPEVLPQLPQNKCVVSNGPLEKIRSALRVTRLDHHFGDRLFSAYDCGFWKPDPRLFLHAAAAMGASPEDCAVVEDSLVGVRAAVAAGMQALFYNRYHDPLDAELAENVTEFREMRALPTLLQSL